MEELSINIPSREMAKKLVENSINNIIGVLKYLETPNCRKILSKQTIETQRKDATVKLKNLIIMLESLS